MLLRFDQPVALVPVTSKADLDALLLWTPVTWASSYSGTWLDAMHLLVTVGAVPEGSEGLGSPSHRAATAVGALRVSVRESGGLTSLDATSVPSNDSAVVGAGSWGDVACDGGLAVYSSSAVVVAFSPPAGASYTPARYSLEVSSTPTFPSGANTTRAQALTTASNATSISVPAALPRGALRFLVPDLAPDVPVYVRVAVSPPTLLLEVAQVLPQPVAPFFWPVGGPGGCACDSWIAGSGEGCNVATGPPQGLAPTAPIIGEWGWESGLCSAHFVHVMRR